MSRDVVGLLSDLGIRPVLVDVGASGDPPPLWNAIAGQSVYVGFDPDLRQMQEIPAGRFFRSVIVNEAVTGRGYGDEVPFHLTKAPYCSSTLPPDAESLSRFLYSDLFAVVGTTAVRAATLEEVLTRLNLPGVDWLKVDSQGTDLRIFNGLPERVRRRVLAVDVEPGLINAYLGEDLFVEVHQELVRSGFWLSDLKVKGAVRMRRSTLSEIGRMDSAVDEPFVRETVRPTPGWCEARYLREMESIPADRGAIRDHALLWAISLLDGQPGFALDLALEYEKRFGRDSLSERLVSEPVRQMRRRSREVRLRRTMSVPARLLRRFRKP